MKKLIFIPLFMLLSLSAFSQGGSNYSIIGIGDINYTGSAAYEGLSGTAAAMPLDNAINFKNPALWSFAKMTRLQAGYKFSQNFVTNNDNKLLQNNGNLTGVSILFSIDTTRRIAASMGLYPYSNVNYFTSSPFSLTVDDVTIQGKTQYQGSGGLNIAYLGGGTKVYGDLYAGASVFASFGTINSEINNIVFGDKLSGFNFDTKIIKQSYLYGWGYKGGLYYKLTNELSLGGYIEQMSTLDVRDSSSFFRTSSPSEGQSRLDTSSIDMPPLIGFGASFKTGKFLLGADFAMQDFSDFNFYDGANGEYRNSMILSFGVARFGNTSYDAEFLDKITYSFGFAYKDLYYKVFGNNINDISLSLGMGIPIPRTLMLDFGLSLGSRGTTAGGLVREFYGKLNIDISIGEEWFDPFERDFE